LLYAINDFGHWTPDDRMGSALRAAGFPDGGSFILDVELWPQERVDRRQTMVAHFTGWLQQEGIQRLDTMTQPSLVMVRVRATKDQAQRLLNHRDVRTVDLPPRFGIGLEMLLTDIGGTPPTVAAPAGAPGVVVLDSGLAAGHPLIGPAVGDAQGFVRPDRRTDDAVPNGHGTFVGGLALHGDMQAAIRAGRLTPTIRLFSGKVFKDDGTDETEFVERAVEEAVQYFRDNYGCRVFNLSYGDLNKVYDGRHLRGLAYTLDRLSRTLGVLFVTSAGNRPVRDLPDDMRNEYPDYLFGDDGRLLDPGTALNAITVGGLANHDASLEAQRHPERLEDAPIARVDQPSPFTRCGPSVCGAVKPDLVDYAGNVAVDRNGRLRTRGLGILSANSGFASGRPLCEDAGTSYAAPVVAHRAVQILSRLPTASPHLLRSLLAAHAKWPTASEQLLNSTNTAQGKARLLRAIGYGRIDDRALYESLERTVTLIAEEDIEGDRHHFFEVPVPPAWWEGARRDRTVTVALAYSPEVRTTRIDYRATRLRFSLVNANTADDVLAAFRRNRVDGMPERSSNRWLSGDQRNGGTLQVSRWTFRGAVQQRRLFVVVTRQDAPWSTVSDQPESYGLAVVLDDRENATINLYAEIRALLQARARARLQV
jgi:hypothetical protein